MQAESGYHPNVCKFCCVSAKEAKLLLCGQCRLVRYCSHDHQKLDWSKHKKFCRSISAITSHKSWQANKNDLNTRELNTCILRLLEDKLQREIHPNELGSILFNKTCVVCVEKENLTYCNKCFTYLTCQNHLNISHTLSECENFEFYLHLITKQRYQPSIDYWISLSCAFIDEPETNVFNMNSFLNKNLKNATIFDQVHSAYISHMLSRPLTIFYALSTMRFEWPQHLMVHIVGADEFEVTSHQPWELLQRLTAVKKITLKFIGPSVPPLTVNNDDIAIATFPTLYHDFVASSASEPRPHVVCSFNCGISEVDLPGVAWRQSLPVLAACGAPLVLTSFVLAEAVLDVEEIVRYNPRLRVRQYKNPFASLVPHLELDGSGVYFSNSILSVLT